jgi:signal transduction histidine kinase/ligand-binding sensor domain-containing protein
MRGHSRKTAAIVLGILLARCPGVFALDPSLAVSQYAHNGWRVTEGFSKGVIFSIAQAADGYLWLGTEFGLLRFDGVRNTAWQPPAGERLPSSDIRSLRVARDGRLWIGTAAGLASWQGGRLIHYPELDGQTIEALLEDREGTIWVGAWAPSVGQLCTIRSGRTQCYGQDGRLGSGVTSLYEDSGGNLWAGGATGVWRWKPGPPQLYPIPDTASRINALIEDDGALLITQNRGITRLKNGKAEAYPLPAGLEFKPRNLLRDRDGGLWIGASVDHGLLHRHEGKTDVFTRSDGLSGDAISCLFEDREGNIWVATVDGLDRFREFAVPTTSAKEGLSSRGVSAVLAETDGTVWLGTDYGLNRWSHGQITTYRKRGTESLLMRKVTGDGLPDDEVHSLFQEDRGPLWVATHRGVVLLESDRFVPISSMPEGIVYSIGADSRGSVWISHQDGLFHLLRARVVERIPWSTLGRKDAATALLHDPVQGGLWLGFREGGVVYFQDGQVRASYAGAEGLGEGRVNGLYIDPDGTLWVATERGLSQVKNGRVTTLSSKNGLPCDTVHWMMEDDAHSVWLYTACGLARIPRPELNAAAADSQRTIQAAVFDDSDGVRSHSFTFGYSPRVARSPDGKLWFLPFDGVSVIDPHHLPLNKLPPPVHIEQLIADGKTYWGKLSGEAPSSPRLPPRVRDLAIDYTALSFVAPEKVRFRFKLEGQDRDWREVVNDRRVEYSNLAPRPYRFRVSAANNSGVWNEEGASLDFSIAPAYYQTTWFQGVIIGGCLALLWAVYQLRVRRIAHEFDVRLEERVNERTRVARDLHDTLLQTFHGVLFRFQAATNMLPERPAEARQKFESAIDRAAQAITEGRDAIQDLRSSTVVANDLAVAISTLGDELATSGANGNGAVVHVTVQGTPRDLHPILRDDIYRIAGEALRNAFRHAHAQRIEVEITYDDRQFRLQVRDDGKGIDRAVLADERRGHFGLPGMRERAELVGGRLEVWSEVGVGTELDLRIPAAKAYATARARRRSWWVGKQTDTSS